MPQLHTHGGRSPSLASQKARISDRRPHAVPTISSPVLLLVAALVALLLMCALPNFAAAQTVSPGRPDGIVTRYKDPACTGPTCGRTLTAEAKDYLRNFDKAASERMRNGQAARDVANSKPPPVLQPQVQEAAKRDARRIITKAGSLVGRGALRAVPFIGWGLTAYEVCDALSRCQWFGRETPEPDWSVAPNYSGWEMSDLPTSFFFNNVLYQDYYVMGPNGNGQSFNYAEGCVAGRPPFPVIAELRTVYDVPCSGSSTQTTVAIRDGWWGTKAEMNTAVAGAATADNTHSIQTGELDLYPEEVADDFAAWVDQPEQATVRQRIAYELDEDVPNPSTEGVRIPAPLTTETYDAYLTRLQGLGLLGRVKLANEYRPAPAGTRPGAVYQVEPLPKTEVLEGTEVIVWAAPHTWEEPEPQPGEPGTGEPGGPLGPPLPGTDTDVQQCVTDWPSPNLEPLKLNLGGKWPFGFVAFILGYIEDISRVGEAPSFLLPEIAGYRQEIDLQRFSPYASLLRQGLAWVGSLFIVIWITGIALNRKLEASE